VIHDKENVLRLIGGEYITFVLKALPESETATEDSQECIIELQP
jgi:hypothetical protein